eukprot:UN10380
MGIYTPIVFLRVHRLCFVERANNIVYNT